MSKSSLTSSDAMLRAAKLAATGEREQAKRLYNELLRANPNHKKAKKALRDLQQETGAQRLQPADFERVTQLLQSGKLDAARSEIRRLCKMHPQQPALHNLRGVILTRSDDKEAALDAFKLAITLKPDFTEALNNLASTFSDLGSYGESLNCYQQLVNRGQADTDVYMNLARTLRAAGQIENAEEALKRAVDLQPLSPGAYVEMAAVQNDLAKHDEAIKTYEKAVQLAPTNRRALTNLARSYSHLQRHMPALEVYQELHNLDPQEIDPLRGMAQSLYAIGQRTAAIERYEQVLSIDPNDAVARHLLASLRGEGLRSGSPAYARSIFETYAANFEQHLTKELGYSLPQRIPEFLERLDGEDAWYPSALDLGCGTGLVGTQLRSYCERLTGVDVASAMILKAEEKAVYDTLLMADVTQMLASSTDRYDLVVCADVLVYIGALEVLFEAIAARLNAGARFIFSTELLQDGDLKLQTTGRFAHSDAYIRRCADDAQLSVTTAEPIQLRMDRGEWIPGSLYVLTATTAS